MERRPVPCVMPLNPLQILIEASAADPAREPEFLAELLEAPLFVHLPLIDESDRIRLVQFTRPDGLSVIPVFSDFDRANKAAQGNVRVGTVPGRDLLAASRGATLMLDPNDTSCTLYPEEIAALLDYGVALPAPVRASSDGYTLEPAESAYSWLGDLAVAAVEPLDPVYAVWLARRADTPADAPPSLVVIVAVASAHEERVIRALGIALAAPLDRAGLTVDATTVDPRDGGPSPTDIGIEPHWCRTYSAQRH